MQVLHPLSVLAASLAAAAIISVVSIEMSPARIFLSITQPTTTTRRNTSGDGGGAGMELNITLAANNTSWRRASVLYRSIYIAICNNTFRKAAEACVGTVVATPLPLRQKPGSVEFIHAAVALEGASSPWASLGIVPSLQDFIVDRNSSQGHPLSVKVTALAMFETLGVPGTRLHNITVTCPGVEFISLLANQSSSFVFICY